MEQNYVAVTLYMSIEILPPIAYLGLTDRVSTPPVTPAPVGNESVPKIMIDNTINLFF